jgi:hypothetical protein
LQAERDMRIEVQHFTIFAVSLIFNLARVKWQPGLSCCHASLSLFLSLSVSLCLSLYLSLSISLCFSLSLSLS